MCGRVSQFNALRRFPKGAARAPEKAGPRRNVTPGTPLLALRKNASATLCSHWLYWGLRTARRQLANARAESVSENPIFHAAFAHGRCAVPVDGFYEWQREGNFRQPWFFHPAPEEEILFLAAIGQPDDPCGPTVCLLTTAANSVMAPIHHRMPILLDRDGLDRWLSPAPLSSAQLRDLAAPTQGNWLRKHPVSPAINHANAPESPNLSAPWIPPFVQDELFESGE